MAFMIMYILNGVETMPDIIKAWEEAGAPGITIIDTTGMNKLRKIEYRDDLPLMPSLADVLNSQSNEHKTLLMLLQTEAEVDRYVEIARGIVGDFNDRRTGVLCVLPVTRVYGLDKPSALG
jgi:hypothetical protein